MEILGLISLLTENNQLLTLFGSLVSAVAAVLAGLAALFSARSASRANRSAATAERRFTTRSVLSDAFAMQVECDRIGQLATDLRLAYQSLAVFQGASGGSREKIFQKAASEKFNHAKELEKRALEVIGERSQLDQWSDQELDTRQVDIAAALREVVGLRERMMEELSDIRIQINDARNARV